jgi:hypothetical protein
MAKDFIAIDTQKNIYEFSEKGIETLKMLHRAQRTTGWQYGLKAEKNNLLMKVVTPKEAQDAVKENALLKQRVAELEAMKDKRGAKTQNESDNTEK